MSRKPVSERLEKVLADIENLENQRKQLLNEQKENTNKKRTHRLCKRGGFVEKLLPDLIILTEEQFETFVKRTTANDFGRKILAEMITAQDGENPTPKATETAGHNNAPPSPKSTNPAQNGGTGGRADEGNASGTN